MIRSLAVARDESVEKVLQHFQFLFTLQGHLFLIVIGIFLRLQQYLFNRSLWLDEAALAQSVVDRSYFGLLKPLEYEQLAPFGFLWASRFFVELFGPSEYALRAFPLICGIASFVLFYFICRRVLDLRTTTFALALFALHGQLIYFSSEFKPYICDVFIALALFYLTLRVIQCNFNAKSFVGYSLVGAVGLWLSYSAIIVFASTVIVLALALHKNKKSAAWLGIPAVLGGLSFYGFYGITKSNFSQSAGLYQNYWQEYFMPLIPKNPWELQVLLGNILGAFKDPGGFYFVGLALVLAILGFRGILNRDSYKAGLLVLPILLTLLAAGVKKYPFAERLILFLVPSLILFVAEGINQIKDYRFLARLVLALIFLHPLLSTSYHFLKLRTREEIKPILSYLNDNIGPEDEVYVEYYGYKTFKFYDRKFQIPIHSDVIVGNKNHSFQELVKDAEALKGKKRVWVLYPHIRYLSDGLNVDAAFLTYLDMIGTRKDKLEIPGIRYMFYEGKTVGAGVYLYDFTKN